MREASVKQSEGVGAGDQNDSNDEQVFEHFEVLFLVLGEWF